MNFLEGKLLKEDGNYYAQFANGAKIKLPKEKGEKLEKHGEINADVTFGIRPEDIKDDEELIEKHPEDVIEVSVEVTEIMGVESYIYTKFNGEDLTVRLNGTSSLKTGDKAKFYINPDKIHVFDTETTMRIVTE